MPENAEIGKSIIAVAIGQCLNPAGRILRRLIDFAIDGNEQFPGREDLGRQHWNAWSWRRPPGTR